VGGIKEINPTYARAKQHVVCVIIRTHGGWGWLFIGTAGDKVLLLRADRTCAQKYITKPL